MVRPLRVIIGEKAPRHTRPDHVSAPGGFSLVESVLAIAILGGLAVAALNAAAGVATARASITARARAQFLGHDLVNEILAMPYADPASDGTSFGLHPTEISSAGRGLFDDVDDYDGLIDSPPQDRAGVPIPGVPANWSRLVTVRYVSPATMIGQHTESGIKLITVSVRRQSATIFTIQALRSSARSSSSPTGTFAAVEFVTSVSGVDP